MGGSGPIVENGWEWVENPKPYGVKCMPLTYSHATVRNIIICSHQSATKTNHASILRYNRTLLRPEFISAMDQFIQRITNYIADVSHSSDFIEFPHSK